MALWRQWGFHGSLSCRLRSAWHWKKPRALKFWPKDVSCDERGEVYQWLVQSLLILEQPRIYQGSTNFPKQMLKCIWIKLHPGLGGKVAILGLGVGNSVTQFWWESPKRVVLPKGRRWEGIRGNKHRKSKGVSGAGEWRLSSVEALPPPGGASAGRLPQ